MDARIFFISFLQMIFAEIEVVILPKLLEGNKLNSSDGECKMLQISDTGKTVVNQEQLDLFWLGTVAVYSPWMDYIGCEKMPSTSNAITLNGSSQLYDCEKACDKYQYVGLQESKCFCLDDNANRYTSCAAKPCGFNNELLCAPDGSNLATVYYRSNTVQFHECAGNFSGNCLLYDIGSLSDTTGCYRPNTCKTNHSIVCTNHNGSMSKDNFYADPKQTWKDALKYCVYNQTNSFLSSISDFRNNNLKSDITQGKFWTSTVRGLKFYNMKDVNRKEEYFCVASRVINRTVTDIQIISCADCKLPVACIIEMEDVRDNIWLILVPSILLVLVIIAVIAVILCKPRCSSVRIIAALTRKYKTSILIGEDALAAEYTTGGSSMNTEPRVVIYSVYTEVYDALPVSSRLATGSSMNTESHVVIDSVYSEVNDALPVSDNDENTSDMAGGSGYEEVKNNVIPLPSPGMQLHGSSGEYEEITDIQTDTDLSKGNLTEIPLTEGDDDASSSTLQKISAGVVFKPSNMNRTTGPTFKRNDYDTMADIKKEMEGVYDHAFQK